MAYQIKKMLDADWLAVNRIYQEGIDTNVTTFQTECPTWEEWGVSHLKHCRLVITLDGEIVGWAAFTAVSSRCVYAGVAEVSIYINKEQRWNGAGKALLFELIRCSEENGFWALQSGIMSGNLASIRLHERCGFRIVGYREKIGCDRYGVWRDTMLMERRSAI